MRIKCSSTLFLMGACLFSLTIGCTKKVAVAPPAPPPAEKLAPPPPAVPTASLSAEPSTIEAGQAVTLRWSSTNATDVRIAGIGTVDVEGTKEVRPVSSMTYELVATGPGGSATSSATINVVSPPPPIVTPPPVETPSLLQRLQELSDAYFDYDKSGIREDARTALAKDADALRSILTDFPDAVIVLEGHCDERGSAEYNIALGERRAASASAYLEGLGLSSDRLRIISYGKEMPQCTESAESCWQKNRRVHFAAGGSATN